MQSNFFYCLAILNDFSATETQANRSSMVAISVGSLVWHLIFVLTSESCCNVSICNPFGTSILSGEIAFVTVSASRLFL